MPQQMNLRKWFGEIDIYLFDQLLKGRFDYYTSILDAGCGNGRNLVYFLRHKFNVFAIDCSPEAIKQVQHLAVKLAPTLPMENFCVAAVEAIPSADSRFDVVISNAVLHFASDQRQFDRMLHEMWRVLKNGGLLFARLASITGLEDRVQHIQERRYMLPDGTKRFLVDEAMLLEITERFDCVLLEPIKTTNVGNMRCMTTLCVRKEV